jgi:hypothetical protein
MRMTLLTTHQLEYFRVGGCAHPIDDDGREFIMLWFNNMMESKYSLYEGEG